MGGRVVSVGRLRYRAWRYRLRHDRCEIRFLLQALRAGDAALDVGAHKGAYTYWMAKRVGQAGRVFAFEPQPELAKRLAADLGRLFGPAVIVENKAVSVAGGTAQLHVPSEGPSPGATLEPRDWPSGHTTCVEAVTLDGYFENREVPARIAFIKCDVEGHEMEVFRGGEGTLRRHRPVLMFECEARHRADGRVESVFEYLHGLGYHGHFFDENGRLHPVAEFQPALADEHNARRVNNFVFLALGRAAN